MKIQNNLSMMAGQEMLKAHKGQEAEDSFEKRLAKAQEGKDEEQLKEACNEMEAYFIQHLFKIMKSSTQLGDGIIQKGEHEEIFEDMLIEEQSKEATKAGGIGLADMLYKQLSKEYAAKQVQEMEQAGENQEIPMDTREQNPGVDQYVFQESLGTSNIPKNEFNIK